MILDFTISNFRSIKEPQTLSFEATNDTHLEDYFVVRRGKYRVLKMLTLMGANASGKSNILEAFCMLHELFFDPCETKTDTIEYDRFVLDAASVAGDSMMAVNFLLGEARYSYKVVFNPQYVRSERLDCQPFDALRPQNVFERTLDVDTMTSAIKWGENYRSTANRTLVDNLLPNRTVFGTFQKINVNIPWMREIAEWLYSYQLPPVRTTEQNLSRYTIDYIEKNPGARRQLVSLLRHADLGVCDYKVEKQEIPIPDFMLEEMKHNTDLPQDLRNQLLTKNSVTRYVVKLAHSGTDAPVYIDFDEESLGTQRYFELAGVLLRLINESHLVPVDELESRMHPDLLEYFISVYIENSRDSQLVFTTHNNDFLGDRDSYRDDSVWFTEKDEFGATTLFSLADFGSDTLRKSTNRYNAYTAGRLGAKPVTGPTILPQKEN